jgi:hypothetical protein
MSGTIESVAAGVTKPAPVTPEAPLEVIMAITRNCELLAEVSGGGIAAVVERVWLNEKTRPGMDIPIATNAKRNFLRKHGRKTSTSDYACRR